MAGLMSVLGSEGIGLGYRTVCAADTVEVDIFCFWERPWLPSPSRLKCSNGEGILRIR